MFCMKIVVSVDICKLKSQPKQDKQARYHPQAMLNPGVRSQNCSQQN